MKPEVNALLEQSIHPRLIKQVITSYDDNRADLLEAAKSYLDTVTDQIRTYHRAGAGGREVVELMCDAVDRMIRQLYRLCSTGLSVEDLSSCCLLAVGGYGRGELNPRSDIDLMFYYSGAEDGPVKPLSERLLYLLWDLSLDVGYSVRTQKDCLEQAARDVTIRTAMLDSRLLAGNEALWGDFEAKVIPVVLGKNSREFVKAKIDELEGRRKKYGSSVYLLEPNIKEGEGGLRDIQTAVWVSQVKFKARTARDLVIRGVLTERQYSEIQEAYDYLWRIRNELHFLSDRKNEQLFFDIQEKIAVFLGYKDAPRAQAVEQFMQDFYERASRYEAGVVRMIEMVQRRDDILGTTKAFLLRRKVADGFIVQSGELYLTDPQLFEKRPAAMMEAFEYGQRHDVELSLELKDSIRNHRQLITDKVRRSKEMVDGFMRILRYRKRVAETLRRMNYLRFLNRFIPEFKNIFCKVQHDVYHTYTVDAHSILAVEEVEQLWTGQQKDEQPELTRLAGEVECPELLILSVLFHDIGKGEGKNHSLRGKEMMPTISRRMGLSKEVAERLEFLVEHHLAMAHIAQHRDLHDPKMITEFSQLMASSETLSLLYLLTYADIRAVGPDVWTDWKGGLLAELYQSTFEYLEKGNFAAEARSERVRRRKKKVVEMLEDEFPVASIKKLVEGFGPRYLLICPKAEIVRHLRLMLTRGDKALSMYTEQNEERAFTGVTLTTLDHSGLFSQITGVLAAHGINILGAQVYTNSNGEILDTLQVDLPGEGLVKSPKKWQRVENDLTAVIERRIRVDALVNKRKQPGFLASRPRPKRPNLVKINNEISHDYTVIDIFAHDHVGLLYKISRTLADLGLYIDVSKISTKVDQVADTFYVKDIFGSKVRDQGKIEEIKQQLLDCLEEDL